MLTGGDATVGTAAGGGGGGGAAAGGGGSEPHAARRDRRSAEERVRRIMGASYPVASEATSPARVSVARLRCASGQECDLDLARENQFPQEMAWNGRCNDAEHVV